MALFSQHGAELKAVAGIASEVEAWNLFQIYAARDPIELVRFLKADLSMSSACALATAAWIKASLLNPPVAGAPGVEPESTVKAVPVDVTNKSGRAKRAVQTLKAASTSVSSATASSKLSSSGSASSGSASTVDAKASPAKRKTAEVVAAVPRKRAKAGVLVRVPNDVRDEILQHTSQEKRIKLLFSWLEERTGKNVMACLAMLFLVCGGSALLMYGPLFERDVVLFVASVLESEDLLDAANNKSDLFCGEDVAARLSAMRSDWFDYYKGVSATVNAAKNSATCLAAQATFVALVASGRVEIVPRKKAKIAAVDFVVADAEAERALLQLCAVAVAAALNEEPKDRVNPHAWSRFVWRSAGQVDSVFHVDAWPRRLPAATAEQLDAIAAGKVTLTPPPPMPRFENGTLVDVAATVCISMGEVQLGALLLLPGRAANARTNVASQFGLLSDAMAVDRRLSTPAGAADAKLIRQRVGDESNRAFCTENALNAYLRYLLDEEELDDDDERDNDDASANNRAPIAEVVTTNVDIANEDTIDDDEHTVEE
jgi:ABC-type amino acid transport substrate-binding protein